MTNKEFRTDGVQLSIECGSLISDNLQSKKPIPTRMNCFVFVIFELSRKQIINLLKKWHTESLTNQDETETRKTLQVFLVLQKPFLFCFCAVVWGLYSLFSIFCIASFGDFTGLHI